MAHRSRAASLRRTSQSAAASRAPSVPSASNCRTVARSRVTFFTGRCRSTRTLCLKGHHGESKIQRTYRRSTRARKRKTSRTRPWLRICSALKHRHPLTGPSPRLSRSIRARIPAEGANILVKVRTRLRGSLHEIAGRQALIVVAGHKTGVSLEDAFWSGLKETAARRVTALSELVSEVDNQRQHTNLSSALRLFVLDFY